MSKLAKFTLSKKPEDLWQVCKELAHERINHEYKGHKSHNKSVNFVRAAYTRDLSNEFIDFCYRNNIGARRGYKYYLASTDIDEKMTTWGENLICYEAIEYILNMIGVKHNHARIDRKLYLNEYKNELGKFRPR